MSTGKFWILTALALIVAGLVGLEVVNDSQVIGLNDQLSTYQADLARAQTEKDLLRQMIQKLVVISQSDPDVADLLHKRGVRINGASPTTPATPPPAAAH